MTLASYIAMLIFDLAVLAGTAYLITEHKWSEWWLVLAVLMCNGSSPRKFIEAGKK